MHRRGSRTGQSTPLRVLLLVFALLAVGCSSGSGDGPDEGGSRDVELDCPGTTTTTDPSTTTTTGPPEVCDAVEDLSPDERASVTEVWDATVSGSVQTPGCSPVSQDGFLVFMTLERSRIQGVGWTRTGAYTCDNGASIPESSIGYEVSGSRRDRITLSFQDGVRLTSTPVRDGRARAVQDTGFGEVRLDLECVQGC